MRLPIWLTLFLLANTSLVSGLYAEDKTSSIPDTDITILPIDLLNHLIKVDVSNPLNVLHYNGYDNQPHFSTDGQQLYFTRMLDEQTDIFVYQIVEQKLLNITNTTDISEYSPTVYDDTRLSVIGVNTEGKQHLRWINLQDVSQKVLNPAVEPVGYHAWLNPEQAVVFVLGEVMTLQLLDIKEEDAAQPLVENIGRCLQRITKNKVSFTQLIQGQHHLFILDHDGNVESTDIILPQGVQDYVWWDSDGVLVGRDSQLWYITSTKETKIVDLEELGINSISRLALDSNKKQIAIVHE